ncbi:unnamed protein product [Ostreobium quekettii]|uniref:Chromo domain-containing protein n=1 Tax=Ostreobium quekettii TaxID=121088 RepID=A0A8S1IRQ2_9CHLO|nr:unnamed protein product [Ostreobium quekettii]
MKGLRTGDSVAFEFQGLNKWSAPVLKAHIFRAGDYGDLLQKENRVENHDTEDDQPKASKGEIAEEEELAVGEILDRQFTANGTALYLVSWAGYEPEENTWEPLSSFSAGLETYKMSDKLRAELGLVGGKGTARRSSKRCNK